MTHDSVGKVLTTPKHEGPEFDPQCWLTQAAKLGAVPVSSALQREDKERPGASWPPSLGKFRTLGSMRDPFFFLIFFIDTY